VKFEYNGDKLVKALRTKRIIELDVDIRYAAKRIGVSPATLSRVENGKEPKADTLATLCYWVEVSLYDCFTPVKSKSKPKKQKS
jgi:transcriptional regulator with XRE-family HTH domain